MHTFGHYSIEYDRQDRDSTYFSVDVQFSSTGRPFRARRHSLSNTWLRISPLMEVPPYTARYCT